MFVIFGIAAMLAFLYVRPHEIYESMRWMTFPLMLGRGRRWATCWMSRPA